MWLCKKHHAVNKDHMERLGDQLRAKAGIQLVFISRQSRSFSTVDSPSPLADTSPHTVEVPPCTAPTATTPMVYCANEETGIKRAVRKPHRLNKKKDPNAVTVSPPVGLPLFLFQPIEGVNGPVNTFYDLGCSDAIFRQGVPGTELRATLLSKGPFQMGGVGDIKTTAEEEWLVQINRTDGKKQLVRGVTLKQITCDFPSIDTTEAVKEIVSSDRNNSFLQSCKVPKIAGGKVDVLLGIIDR